MYAQCPHCQTVFRVTDAQLNVAQGQVRCGHCQQVFNAAEHILKELPKPTETTKPKPKAKINPDSAQAKLDLADLLKEIAPPPRKTFGKVLFWLIIGTVLVALIASQYLWFMQRDTVLQHPQIRPWLERFCYTFLCTLPPTRHLDSFQIEKRAVTTHPTVPNALQVDVTFMNRATFPQPYPELQLTFEDANGHILARRRFKPTEYLRTTRIDRDIPASSAVHVKLEVVDVANVIEDKKVMEGYRFEFF